MWQGMSEADKMPYLTLARAAQVKRLQSNKTKAVPEGSLDLSSEITNKYSHYNL